MIKTAISFGDLTSSDLSYVLIVKLDIRHPDSTRGYPNLSDVIIERRVPRQELVIPFLKKRNCQQRIDS